MKKITLVALFLFTVLGGAAAFGAPSAPAQTQTGPDKSPESIGSAQAKARPVAITPLKQMLFVEKLKTQGNLESAGYADVPAKIGGTLEAVYVEEGDLVQAGETRLFKTESLKLEKNREIRRHELSVARYALLVKKAGLEQVEVDLAKARRDYERFKSLQANGTVSLDAMEQHESRYRQLLASRKFNQAQIDLSAEQVRQAQAALDIAEKDLRDAVVMAPINGVVSRRNQEPGETAGTKDPVVRIEDTSSLKVSALIPARYYASVVPGKTEVRIRVYGQDVGSLPIRYKSPTIDARTRSFEIKCNLDNTERLLAPGSMAEMEVIIRSREGLGAPREAVVVRSGQPAVFVVTDNKAALVRIEKGFETDGWVEIQGEGLASGTAVVTSGQTGLDDNTRIRLIREAD